MATFGYYDNWRSATLECPRCGWKGTFDQGSVELHEELMDSSCPACDFLSAPMLAIVSYPTTQETEQNWEKLTDPEKRELLARKRWLAAWQAASLKSINQLPDLAGPTVALVWDQVDGDAGGPFTVIRHGDTEIWREPACWEGYERFGDVVQILKQKYEKRLVDVVPTPASNLYLFGDKFSAPEYVVQIRKALNESNGPTFRQQA